MENTLTAQQAAGPLHTAPRLSFPVQAAGECMRLDHGNLGWKQKIQSCQVSLQLYPPSTKTNEIKKDTRPKTISKSSLCAASLALALGI